MPSNQEYKGKGMKGRNYDELSGVGTSRAGVTGTTGNLNDAGHDGGVGAPDPGDSGNRQSARPEDTGGEPGTPALGKSQRGQGNRQSSPQGDNQQRGNLQGGNLQGGQQDQDKQRK